MFNLLVEFSFLRVFQFHDFKFYPEKFAPRSVVNIIILPILWHGMDQALRLKHIDTVI